MFDTCSPRPPWIPSSSFYAFTLVSDIAIFVLKRDVKLQLTNYASTHYLQLSACFVSRRILDTRQCDKHADDAVLLCSVVSRWPAAPYQQHCTWLRSHCLLSVAYRVLWTVEVRTWRHSIQDSCSPILYTVPSSAVGPAIAVCGCIILVKWSRSSDALWSCSGSSGQEN